VPIIYPIQASSIDRGRSWIISGITDVFDFGVSKNFIYGGNKNGWFLYNVKSGLYAEYSSMEELTATLITFKIPLNPIDLCINYFEDTLPIKGRCYWYPKPGQKYRDYEDIIPDTLIDLSVTSNSSKDISFRIKEEIQFSKTKIYFFKVHYDKKKNDLLYFSINNSPPVLIKDGILIPAFIKNQEFNVTLYTPFPVAEDKKITEKERIHISKNIKIKMR
jgi:hypothetical protein